MKNLMPVKEAVALLRHPDKRVNEFARADIAVLLEAQQQTIRDMAAQIQGMLKNSNCKDNT